MQNEYKKDYAISLIRFVSTAFIITCHIMQYREMELAKWFNVGVQIFLCMSGFLYGKREHINDDITFYIKNTLKIMIDYYVVVIPIILLFAVFHSEKLSLILILKILLAADTIPGGEHLWYIPYCLFCYLITPFLSRYFDYFKDKHLITSFLVLCIITIIYIEVFLGYFNSACIICYILGFFLGSISTKTGNRVYNRMSNIIIAGAVLSNSIQIICDYYLHFELNLNGRHVLLYYKFCSFAHVALGVTLFIIFRFVFSRLFEKGYPNSIRKICLYSDKYSYDVYLVHQFVILGPFSLMHATGLIELNIVLIMIIIILSAVAVNFIANHIRKGVLKKINEEGICRI